MGDIFIMTIFLLSHWYFYRSYLQQMKASSAIIATALAINLCSCANMSKQSEGNSEMATTTLSADNPFIKESTLQYQAPDFSKIKDSHFKPAIEVGLKQQLEEISKIANDAAAPTFENTFV